MKPFLNQIFPGMALTTRIAVAFFVITISAHAADLELAIDPAAGEQGRFAAEEIRREAILKGLTLGDAAGASRISITVASDVKSLPQSYQIRVRTEGGRRLIDIRGADATGAMYGGLDIAEAIHIGTLDSIKDADHKPHIAKRGIKFNIPLDLRTPSYTDTSDSGQANISEVWEKDFWIDYLNAMARNRYNVLSLWSLHPFPSLVKVPEFPEVALDDVWRTRAKLDDDFSLSGQGFVRPGMLANHEVVKRMTMNGNTRPRLAIWAKPWPTGRSMPPSAMPIIFRRSTTASVK